MLDQVVQSPFQPDLNVSRDGTSTAFLGNMCQCLNTLIVKNCVVISNIYLIRNILHNICTQPSVIYFRETNSQCLNALALAYLKLHNNNFNACLSCVFGFYNRKACLTDCIGIERDLLLLQGKIQL